MENTFLFFLDLSGEKKGVFLKNNDQLGRSKQLEQAKNSANSEQKRKIEKWK